MGIREESSFRMFVDEAVGCLRTLAARQIRAMEVEERLPHNRRSVDGVVDETLLLAWQRYSERPETQPLEEWLALLLSEVLNTAAEHAGETTPDIGEADADDSQVDPESDDFQSLQCELLSQRDPVIWEDLLPSTKDSTTVGRPTPEEEREAILSLLPDSSPSDRLAFSLHTFEGYACDEIAEIQGRDVSQVEQAVARSYARMTRHYRQ